MHRENEYRQARGPVRGLTALLSVPKQPPGHRVRINDDPNQTFGTKAGALLLSPEEDTTMRLKTLAGLAAALLSNIAWSQTQDCRSVLNGVLTNANKIQVTVSR